MSATELAAAPPQPGSGVDARNPSGASTPPSAGLVIEGLRKEYNVMRGSLTESLGDGIGRSVSVLGARAAAALISTYWVLERRR